MASALALVVERHRTDRLTVYGVKSGSSYHSSSRCQTLRRSNEVLTLSLTDAKGLGRKPC